MEEKTKQFTVRDVLQLVVETIRDRLALLGEVEKMEALTGQVNKQAALERLELLSLALGRTAMPLTSFGEVSSCYGMRATLKSDQLPSMEAGSMLQRSSTLTWNRCSTCQQALRTSAAPRT